jgi:hypothetical protein
LSLIHCAGPSATPAGLQSTVRDQGTKIQETGDLKGIAAGLQSTVRDQGTKIGELERKTAQIDIESGNLRIAYPNGAMFYFPKDGNFNIRMGIDRYCFYASDPSHPSARDKELCFKPL